MILDQEAVAKRVADLIPTGGLLIGLDGYGGAGKSVLAEGLAKYLSAQLVHVDDFFRPSSDNVRPPGEHGGLFDLDRLAEEVLGPLSRGDDAHPSRYDWDTDNVVPGTQLVAQKLTIVEGVYSTSNKLRHFYDLMIWIDSDEMTRLRRGLERDGEAARREWVDEWMPGERHYGADEMPASRADLRLDAGGDDDPPSYLLLDDGRSAGERYHKWYFESRVWETTTWRGVTANKSVSDLWLYQELICELEPSAVVELGTGFGGATLFFTDVLAGSNPDALVLSIDIDHSLTSPVLEAQSGIELWRGSSSSLEARERLERLRSDREGNWFVVVDSDHSYANVLAELLALHEVTIPGDRIVVEDTNLGGRPALPKFGAGPFEATADFLAKHGDNYRLDHAAESKFGFTFAPKGFLERTS